MSINKYNPTTGELELLAGGTATLYADVPIGTVQAYIGATAPDGWLICDGSAVSRTSYAKLFELIGTNYGEGDGSTTFNLPDMRNRAVMGAGSNGNLHTVQEDATAKNGMQTFSAQGEGKTGGAGTHTHAVLAYNGAKANIANVYARSIIASNMETTLGEYTQNADFGGTSMQYLQDAGLHFHYVGLRSDDPETRPKNIRMNWIIKALQVGAPADFMDAVDEAVEEAVDEAVADLAPVDTIANGNMKAVTSNAVAGLLAFEDVSFSKTLGAQGQDYASINVPAKSGYTAKMVSVKNMAGSVGTGAIICTAMLNVNSTVVTVIMHNQSNAGQDCTGNVTILYTKN